MMEDKIKEILRDLGENPEREGLQKTPHRVVKSLQFLTQGYRQNIKEVINNAVFTEDQTEMVVLKDVDFFSLCEHHLLPFFGKCHLAYIPDHKILGLSKLARVVDVFSRRFQVQERLTKEIAHTIQEVLSPRGVGVVMEGTHLCMQMRGVEKQNSVAVTSCMLGCFREQPATRAEFMALIHPRA